MTKTKTPFFSMGSQGSVGGSITTQRRHGSTLIRGKPFPSDPYSLPQAYQRWLYEDYAYLWRQQSVATKQSYATLGSRFHYTGFQYWMKYQLTNLPDIAGMWHLDEKSGVFAIDHSRNSNNGTILGASPVTGLIDGAFGFDGINDRVRVDHSSTLNVASGGDFSIETFFTVTATAAFKTIFAKRDIPTNGIILRFTPPEKIQLITTTGGVDTLLTSLAPPTFDTWYHLIAQRFGALLQFYLNGDFLIQGACPTGDLSNTEPLYIGVQFVTTLPHKGLLDHLIFRTRALDATEAKRHSERRYPVQ